MKLFVRTALLLGWAAGCAGREAGGPAVCPVEGVLVVDGAPAANARVAFHPAGGGPAARPVGVTGPDGGFRLSTHAPGDGAPAGDYVVTVLWPDDSMPVDECECPDPAAHDRLRGAYLNPATSPLRATVGPGPNRVALRAEVGSRGWNLPRRPGA